MRPRSLRAAGVARWEVAALVLTLAVALALRAVLARDSPAFDELFTRAIAVAPSPGAAYDRLLATENTPPLLYAVVWLLARVSHAALWLRLPSVLAGVATAAVVWAIGRRVYGARAGLVAAALLALSPWALFFGSEARAYALMTLWVAASTLALLHAVRRPCWWAPYGALAFLAMFTHYTAAFVLAAQAAWALWAHREHWRGLLTSQGAAALLFAAWIPHLDGDKAAGIIGAYLPLSVRNVAEQTAFALAGTGIVGLDRVPGRLGWVLAAIIAAAAVVAVVRAREVRRETILLAAVALATPAGLILYSALADDLLAARNLWASLPAAAALAGAALARVPGRWGPAFPVAALALMAVMAARALSPDNRRPDYAAVARALTAQAPPDAGVVELPLLSTAEPLRTALAIHLPAGRSVVQADRARECLWRAGRPLYVVTAATSGPPPLAPAPAGTRLRARRVFRGAYALQLLRYDVPPARDPAVCARALRSPGVSVRGSRTD